MNLDDRAAIYKAVFSSPQGEKVYQDILNVICRVNGGLFNADTHMMAHSVGRRDVGLEIKTLVERVINEIEKPEVKT